MIAVHIDWNEMADLYVAAGVETAGNNGQEEDGVADSAKSLGKLQHSILAPMVPRS